ncbi:hypothetical protein SLS58_010500, partial [Diplodia intermedia]
MYNLPAYAAPRPRMRVYHGGADATLKPQLYAESMKQWAALWGYAYDDPPLQLENSPAPGYFTTVWGPGVQGVYADGVGYTVP